MTVKLLLDIASHELRCSFERLTKGPLDSEAGEVTHGEALDRTP